MARVYYKKEQIKGVEYISDKIDIDMFDYIIDNADDFNYEIPQQKSGVFAFLNRKTSTFNFVQVRKDDIPYSTTEGDFYLPNALIFLDEDDYPFPSVFYFLAKLDQKLELRVCHGGEGVMWFQIPDLHEEVTDKNVFAQIDNTVIALKKLVEEGVQNKLMASKSSKKVVEKVELSDDEKQIYLTLFELLLSDVDDKKRLEQLVHTPIPSNEDFFFYLRDFINDEEINLLVEFDWKEGVEDFVWGLNRILSSNFPDKILLEQGDEFDEDTTISEQGVFMYYDNLLRSQNLQMSFIDIQSDSYVTIIHSIEVEDQIAQLINDMGFDWDNAGSIKL